MLFLQSTGKSELPAVLNQLYPMIKSYHERNADDYDIEDILVLLVYIYSVTGEVQQNNELEIMEREVKKVLIQSLCDEPKLSSLLQNLTG